MNMRDELQGTVEELVQAGKGILAVDESSPTIAKRFDAIGVESTVDSRRDYRRLILATPSLGEFVSGVILFEETLWQDDEEGQALLSLATEQGIVPGIKVDKGKLPIPGAPGDEITQGLDGLDKRLEAYKDRGARFAKWRDVYHISNATPSQLAMEANAEVLARYASLCQEQGIVPIVEPEVLIDGDHPIDRCAAVSEAVLHEVFHALHKHHVVLEHMLLKPSMVTPGKSHPHKASPRDVAEQTIKVFRRAVPAAVPGICFLSGGQTPQEATANLNALNCMKPQPWQLSFSYGRALQQPALQVWKGNPANAVYAQTALYHRAKLNGAARRGKYDPALESTLE